MKVILKQDVEHLGFKHEIKSVKPGYARNYLIPRAYVIPATIPNIKMLEETLKQRAGKEQKLIKELQGIVDALKEITVKVGAKVSTKGKIFGSVTTLQISDAVKALGFNIDRKQISLKEDAVKELGAYTADVKLHKDITFKLNFEVVKD